jgi:hypothetical protein
MTLCLAWKRNFDSKKQLVMATDSLITGGYTYPHGTKLVVFHRNDCALCWEGDTSFTYSFAENARVDVEYSDHLCTKETPLFAVVQRIVKVFNQLWEANLSDKHSVYHNAQLSFFFGGWCPHFKARVLWLIKQSGKLGYFKRYNLSALPGVRIIGSGSSAAADILRADPRIPPYRLLQRVIEDKSIEDVGGVPQIVTVDSEGLELVGVIKDDERYLFGRKLDSLGHHGKIRYIPYDDNEFTVELDVNVEESLSS